MCNRYVTPDEATIERYWHIGRGNQWRGEATLSPRAMGHFLRPHKGGDGLELVVGQWGLIPWFAETPKLRYSTNNACYEELAHKASYKQSWMRGLRCIIPAWSFDEPCWETGRNVWWRFERADGAPWGLAGLWNRWTDKATGEVVESYTMLTSTRMHTP